MIAASEEMHDEKLEFSSLIEHLNEVLEPRGIDLKRVKWNPETDGAMEDFMAKLTDCEMCLTLYWKELAGNSEEELKRAYQQMKGGSNPHKLYVFFKEPTEELSDALKDFKANFVTNYGHFFCKFENVDTMNLHFILQFEAYQNHIQDQQNKFIEVKDGKVMVGDKPFVALDQIPFAALNKDYARLQQELADLDMQVAEARARHRADPNNEKLEEDLFSLRSLRKKKADEFEEHQQHLYSMALKFDRLAGEQCSERIRKARELFEAGDAIGADEILNMEEMKREAEWSLKQYEQNRSNLEQTIEEFRLKADTVMANTLLSVSDRFKKACEAYIESINLARQINLDSLRYSELLFDYSHLLLSYGRESEAVNYLNEALILIRKSIDNEKDEDYLVASSRILNNLGVSYWNLLMYNESQKKLEESLNMRRILMKMDHDYIYDTIESLGNIAGLLLDQGRTDLAEEKANELLELCNELKNGESRTAYGLNLIGMIHEAQGNYDIAVQDYQQAIRIREKLAKNNPEKHLPDLANTINNLADSYTNLELYDDARKYYDDALEIRKKLAERNPIIYSVDVAQSLSNIARLDCAGHSYSESLSNYLEAMKLYEYLRNGGSSVGEWLAKVYENIGFVYYKMEQYDESLIFYQYCKDEYIQILKKDGDCSEELIGVISTRSTIFEELSRYDEAIKELDEAKFICNKYVKSGTEDFLKTNILITKNIAVLYDSLELYEKALINYEGSLKKAQELYAIDPNSKGLLAVILMLTALAHHQLSHYDIALDMYGESLKLFNELPQEIKEEHAEEIETLLECIDEIKSQI